MKAAATRLGPFPRATADPNRFRREQVRKLKTFHKAAYEDVAARFPEHPVEEEHDPFYQRKG